MLSNMQVNASPGYASAITCSHCKRRVPLALLNDHACPESPRRPYSGSDGLAGNRDARKLSRPANIDTAAWNRDVRPPRAYASPGLSPSTSTSSIAPSSAQLSPSFSAGSMSQSTSQSSGLSLSRSSSSTSSSSLDSPNSASPTSAKLPFFDKYNRVYGEGGNSSPMASTFSSRSLNNLDRSPPRPSQLREHSTSSPNGSNTLRARPQPPRSATVPQPKMPSFDRTRSEDILSRQPVHGRKAQRPKEDNESIGRAFLEASPFIPDGKNGQSGLSYRASPPRASNKILAADALDSLLEDLSIETSETRRARGSLDAYYFDLDDSLSEDDTTPTPRASAAAAPHSDYGARTHHHHHARPSPTKTAFSAPEVSRSRGAVAPISSTVTCRTCEKSVAVRESVERDGGRFCGDCYASRYLPKCRKCKFAIKGSAISSGDGKVKGKFHVECFNCFACSAPFPNKEFYVFDERPYCAHDYHRLAGSLCGNCGSGIEGQCVSLDADLGNRRFHPSCFTCSHSSCREQLNDYHFVVDEAPYCERHAERKAAGQGRRAEKRKTLVRPFARRH